MIESEYNHLRFKEISKDEIRLSSQVTVGDQLGKKMSLVKICETEAKELGLDEHTNHEDWESNDSLSVVHLEFGN